MYSSQCSRSFVSPVENFQFFSGRSMRSRNRRFCSDFETWRKTSARPRVARQILLEVADVLEPFLPDVLAHQPGRQLLTGQKFRMHAHHERFLVITAVEDADAAAIGQHFMQRQR